jgi:hypothetical protein
MRMLIITAMLSLISNLTLSQEFHITDEQAALGQRLGQEHLKSAIKLSNFVDAHGKIDMDGNFIANDSSDPNSEIYQEYQTLKNDEAQKREAFYGLDFTKTPDVSDKPDAPSIPIEQAPEPERPEQSSLPQETTTPQQKTTKQNASPILPSEEPITPVAKPVDTKKEPAPIILPAEPEPVADEAVVIPKASPTELKEDSGIDTVSLQNPQGNWLFKRIWWERAEERYEKIRQLVDAVWESRTIFFVKRNELDRNVLDPFYLTIGIGQGELQAILSELVDFLEKKREQQGDLSEQERMLYEVIATEEEALKQLQLDVESVTNLDRSIDDALGTLMDQINRVRKFEEQAWQNFREIARILDDTKARELYYIIEGTARNIKNISTYLEQDFFKHFTTLISEATKHITRIQNQIKALKEKGVTFKHQSELLKQAEQELQQKEDETEDKEVAPKPKLGWFGWIMSELKNTFNTIISIISMPYNMLFGK